MFDLLRYFNENNKIFAHWIFDDHGQLWPVFNDHDFYVVSLLHSKPLLLILIPLIIFFFCVLHLNSVLIVVVTPLIVLLLKTTVVTIINSLVNTNWLHLKHLLKGHHVCRWILHSSAHKIKKKKQQRRSICWSLTGM